MSGLGLVSGVLALNLLLTLIGYCLLYASLRGRMLRIWLSYAGVALLVGAALVCSLLSVLAFTGLALGLWAFALCAGGLAAVGLVAGQRLPDAWRARIAAPAAVAPATSRLESFVATAAACAIVAFVVLTVVGGFRSSPWLDDTWTMWVPKGRLLGTSGLDPRFFSATGPFDPFLHPDYPFWWSLLTNLNLSFVGSIDLRAVDAQLTILVAAFLAALARLLWGIVRPSVLLPGLLFLALSPELVRQGQAGGADLPLAIFLTLFVVAGTCWLVSGNGFYLVLAFAAATVVMVVKVEGAPELLAALILITLVAVWSRKRRVAALWATAALAFLVLAPWLLWQSAHDVSADPRVSHFRLRDPAVKSPVTTVRQPETEIESRGAGDGTWDTLEVLARELVNPANWLLSAPLLLALSVALALRRRIEWLAPFLVLLVGAGLVVVGLWLGSAFLDNRIRAAASRVLMPAALTIGIAIPFFAEELLRPGRRTLVAPGPIRLWQRGAVALAVGAGVLVMAAAPVPKLHGLYTRLVSPHADRPDPHYGTAIDAAAMRRAGDVLPDDATVFVYTPNDPAFRHNVMAGVRLFFTPAAVTDQARDAKWVFSYDTPQPVPPGVRAREVVPLADQVRLARIG